MLREAPPSLPIGRRFHLVELCFPGGIDPWHGPSFGYGGHIGHIFYYEFDGKRRKRVLVKIIGE